MCIHIHELYNIELTIHIHQCVYICVYICVMYYVEAEF